MKNVIIGNSIFSNSGSGIDQGGLDCIVVGNIVFSNGVTGGSGVTARYGDATYNSSRSVYSGNRCFDTAGAGGTQLYGYTEESSSLVDIEVHGNQLKGNKTGPQNILSSTTSFKGIAVSGSATYDPASLGTGTGATTDVFCSGARVGDLVTVSFTVALQGIQLWGWVNAANNVKVRFWNDTGGTLNLASGTLVVKCEKHKLSADI